MVLTSSFEVGAFDTIFSTAQTGLRHKDLAVATHRVWPTSCSLQEQSVPQHANNQPRLHRKVSFEDRAWCGDYHLYCVFGGHRGLGAVRFAADTIIATVESHLPICSHSQSWGKDWMAWAGSLQQALVLAVLDLHMRLSADGVPGGCSATLVLQVGSLLTCASLGSTGAELDLGYYRVPLSGPTHSLSTNLVERRRMLCCGTRIAALDLCGHGPAAVPSRGSGPLRMWPGGLPVSRSLGDLDLGRSLLPLPQVTQVLIPHTGCRLVLGSERVWKGWGRGCRGSPSPGVFTLLHTAPFDVCAQAAADAITQEQGPLSHAALVVADILPPGVESWGEVSGCGGQSRWAEAGARRQLSICSLRSCKGRRDADPSPGCALLAWLGLRKAREPRSNRRLAQRTPPKPRPNPTPSKAPESPQKGRAPGKLLVTAQYDVAALLGLLPWEISEEQRRESPPPWFTEKGAARMRSLLRKAEEVWEHPPVSPPCSAAADPPRNQHPPPSKVPSAAACPSSSLHGQVWGGGGAASKETLQEGQGHRQAGQQGGLRRRIFSLPDLPSFGAGYFYPQQSDADREWLAGYEDVVGRFGRRPLAKGWGQANPQPGCSSRGDLLGTAAKSHDSWRHGGSEGSEGRCGWVLPSESGRLYGKSPRVQLAGEEMTAAGGAPGRADAEKGRPGAVEISAQPSPSPFDCPASPCMGLEKRGIPPGGTPQEGSVCGVLNGHSPVRPKEVKRGGVCAVPAVGVMAAAEHGGEGKEAGLQGLPMQMSQGMRKRSVSSPSILEWLDGAWEGEPTSSLEPSSHRMGSYGCWDV